MTDRKAQTNTMEDDFPCVCMQIRKAGRVVTQLYDQYLRQAGIRSPQYAMLRYIGATNGALAGELGEALCLEQSTVTRNVDLLKEKGYVEFTPHPDDGRKKVLFLTEAGRGKLAEARILWRQAQQRMRVELGENGLADLCSALDGIFALKRTSETVEE